MPSSTDHGASCSASVQRNLDDARSPAMWRAVAAELVGTLILVFTGVAVCQDHWQEDNTGPFKDDSAKLVKISLTFGIAVATAVWCIAHISGGHINPAVTVAMLVTRKITLVRAVFYVIAQCTGAAIGAAIFYGLHFDDNHHGAGSTGLQVVSTTKEGKVEHLSQGKGFGMELMITFVLVFTVFASCDKGRSDLGGSVPLTIGLSVALCHFFAVYWVGPISGGILAGLLYDLVFATDASLDKFKHWLMPPAHGAYSPTPSDDKGNRPLATSKV